MQLSWGPGREIRPPRGEKVKQTKQERRPDEISPIYPSTTISDLPEAMISTRRLRTADRSALAAHLLALSSEDRRLRFGGPSSNNTLRDYVARIDFDRDAVFGFLADDLSLGGAAHVAVVDGVAELGLSVLAAYRRRGIGTALFQLASDFARNIFICTLLVRCLAENAAMIHIARKSGMKVVTRRGAAEAHLELPPPDARTMAADFLVESLALFDSSLKAQLR
jgi:GNAT superfamily N-acetyltransferase